MADDLIYPSCFGPYLRYAISAQFRDFVPFDESSKLFFLVEFIPASDKEPDPAGAFETKMERAGFQLQFGPADDNTRYSTLRADKRAVLSRDSFDSWNGYVSRVELSLPVSPRFLGPFERRKLTPRSDKQPPVRLLVGIMDDGCPFAAARFLRVAANGLTTTRVRGIWDQNSGKHAIAVNGRSFGMPLSDFLYGLEYRRTPPDPTTEIGLDEWRGMHVTPAGSTDEDGCYADAQFTRLASQQSHGAHVMDLLAGNMPISSRVGPASPGDRRDPPTWAAGNPATDPACDADIVFVQFSDDCIKDATGVWLKAFVVDGIRYIMSYADPNYTENVIINLSYGPTTGPHDGTAELEATLSDLVAYYDGVHNKPKLDIFLAAGNSYLTDEHLIFTGDDQHSQVEWTWRLPPDNAVLCFAEIWMDNAVAGGVRVTLTSPSGQVHLMSPSTITGVILPTPVGNTAQLIGPILWGNDRMWLIEVGSTIAAPGVVNEHGDWTIKVSGVGVGAKVDAYVARTDPNMGVTTGAKRSSFVDPAWERTRSAAASCTFVDGEFDNTGSLLSRFGTLNGIATAKDDGVHVAGGYIRLDGRKSTYSSAGPSRDYPTTPRAGPDYVLLCDEGCALQGILAGGTRSGSVFRLIGTSTAAPQLARQWARYVNGIPLPPATDIPTTLSEREKRGGGDLPPP